MRHLLSFTLCYVLSFSMLGPIALAVADGPTPVDDRLSPAPTDWPWWRGPNRNGVAVADQQPPKSWSSTENVLWKADVAGRGYGSPIVVGNQVLLQIADIDRDLQALAAYDRDNGKLRWEAIVHRGGLTVKNPKSTAASSTPACAADRLFVNFLNGGAVYTTAIDLSGKQLWQTKISDYVIHQGFGSSPSLYRSLVIVSADNKGGGAIVALQQSSGEVVWRRDRPKTANYPSPTILHVAGRDQVLISGCNLVTSLDPLTGETLWETDGATTECVTSTVTDGQFIFTSGGYPRNHVSAIRADGSAQTAWENKNRVYVPSMLVRDGYLYAMMDAGIAGCWRTETGEEMWRSRVGGTFSASPVLVGDLIYASNEAGETFIFRASPERFELLEKNRLGEEVISTPAICNGQIFQRVAESVDGHRQERLYCLSR